jgi:hypothetical protein
MSPDCCSLIVSPNDSFSPDDSNRINVCFISFIKPLIKNIPIRFLIRELGPAFRRTISFRQSVRIPSLHEE